MASKTQRLTFSGSHGAKLAARLDLPPGPVRAYALFAHCFTCSKDLAAARAIAAALARRDIAVLRFDFTGLGSSDGEFAHTNFSSNVADIRHAAEYLRDHYAAPSILIGHSLGGAAVLAVAGEIAEVKAVATIGAPADVAHVLHNFSADIDHIEQTGAAEVSLGGRPFTIEKQFIDDVRRQNLADRIASMRKALMVLHSPIDNTVGIDNAGDIFQAAKHPKSFVSLDTADHLLSNRADAEYAAEVIAAWAGRFVAAPAKAQTEVPTAIRVEETGNGLFQNRVQSGRHGLFADEPASVGGDDTGPTPYDFLSIALGACTAMTLRLYARHKKLAVDRIRVDVDHAKVHAKDCLDCAEELSDRPGKIDRFERVIQIEGELDESTRQRMLQIADRCPVHKTLEAGAAVVSRLDEPT